MSVKLKKISVWVDDNTEGERPFHSTTAVGTPSASWDMLGIPGEERGLQDNQIRRIGTRT